MKIEEVEGLGIYDTMQLYFDKICVKEIPFFIALQRCFHQDKRLAKGYKLVLSKLAILSLKKKATTEHGMDEMKNSLIYKLDSLYIYKKRKNRYKRKLCNFIIYADSGAYPIPKTGGAKLVAPGKIKGSIYYNKYSPTNKMTVYFHTGGIKLELPGYAKKITFGLLKDIDIGIAELEYINGNWRARLLYVISKDNPDRKGWTFNLTKCNKIRPYSKEKK